MVAFLSWILFCASQVYLRSGTSILPIQIWNRLHDRFLFKFFLHNILVGCAKLSFCERLTFNTFSHTFVHFTIVILTSHDFMSFYIVLHVSISDRFFQTLSICFRCIIYVTTSIVHNCFGIIKLLCYFPYCYVCSITGFYSFCSWQMSTRVVVRTYIVIL